MLVFTRRRIETCVSGITPCYFNFKGNDMPRKFQNFTCKFMHGVKFFKNVIFST